MNKASRGERGKEGKDSLAMQTSPATCMFNIVVFPPHTTNSTVETTNKSSWIFEALLSALARLSLSRQIRRN
jgi:hypothetical protein